MSELDEKAINDAFAQDEEEQEEAAQEEQEQEEQQEQPQLSALELEAQDMGHTSKDEFIERGGDPERWKSAHEYVQYGKIKSALDQSNAKIDKMQSDFDSRLDNVNKFNKVQTDAKIKALRAEQREAVSEGDTKKFDAKQNQIDDLKVEPEEPATDTNTVKKDPEIVAWESKNPWINDVDDPRSDIALGLWNGFSNRNPNATIQEALSYVDKQMKTTPETNPRRDSPTNNERSTQTNKKTGKLSWADLTQEDLDMWHKAGFDMWGNDQKAFLQSVKDSRAGQ